MDSQLKFSDVNILRDKKLGFGLMSEVFKGVIKSTGKLVAVKIVV